MQFPNYSNSSYNVINTIIKYLGVKNNNINPCLKGKRKSEGGYKWGYADDYERIPFRIFDLEIYKKKVA